jgi:hypothetical protein
LLLLVVRNGTGIKNRHHRSAGPSRLDPSALSCHFVGLIA